MLAGALVMYLSLRGGGYDVAVREEIGLVAWWAVVLALVTGVATSAITRSRGVVMMLALMAALMAWTAIGVIWSPSAERTVTEVLRVATLLGIAVVVALFGGRSGPRNISVGVAVGVLAVAALALLSRSLPDLFPEDTAAEFLPGTRNRLNYPLSYWNGLAALIAIGLPLLVHFAATSRGLRAAAWGAGLPIAGFALFLTLSRGGTLAALVALVVLVALGTPRIPLLLTTTTLLATTAVLGWQSERRLAYADALGDELAADQGLEMLVWIVGASLIAGLLSLLIGRREIAVPGFVRRLQAVPRRRKAYSAAAVAVLAVVALFGAGIPGSLWDSFRGEYASNSAGAARLTSISGNSRFEYWEASVDALEAEPVTGIGPGTWEFWWAEHGTTNAFARDGHSLFLEVLAELGPIGLLLILAIAGVPLIVIGARLLFAGRNSLLAALLGGCVAFTVAASLDWAWEMTVVPVAFLMVAMAGMFPERGSAISPTRRQPLGWGLGIAGVVIAVALAISLAAEAGIRESQAAARGGDLASALDHAREASGLEPFSAAAKLQEALVLEAGDELRAAAEAAREAAGQEAVNWRHWYVLSRIEEARGEDEAAREAFEQARSLNPRSPLFASASG